jgi:hypothetical protein
MVHDWSAWSLLVQCSAGQGRAVQGRAVQGRAGQYRLSTRTVNCSLSKLSTVRALPNCQ